MARYNIEIKLSAGRTASTLQKISDSLDALASSAGKAGAAVKGVDLSGLGTRAQRAGRDASAASSGLKEFERTARAVHRAISLVVFGAITKELQQLGRAALNAARDWERMGNTMRAVTGDQSAANREIQFIVDLSKQLGLNLRTAAGDYAKFAAAARGTALEGGEARKVFESVSRAITVLGLDADRSHLVFLALQQMMSKGTVQSEELRRQLGEHLPGAFQLAAKAMGVTTEEFNKMLKRGEVMATDLLPRLSVELERAFGGEVETASQSLNAVFNRMQTSIFEMSKSVGDGLAPSFKSLASGMGEIASNEKILPFFKSLGEIIGGIALGPLEFFVDGMNNLAAAMSGSRVDIFTAQISTTREQLLLFESSASEFLETMRNLAAAGEGGTEAWRRAAEGYERARNRADEYRAELDRLEKALDKAKKGQDEVADGGDDLQDSFVELVNTLRSLRQAQVAADDGTAKGARLAAEYGVAISDLENELRRLGVAFEEAPVEKWQEKLENSIAANLALLNAFKVSREEFELMQAAIKAGIDVTDGFSQKERQLATTLKETSDAVDGVVQSLKDYDDWKENAGKDDADLLGSQLKELERIEELQEKVEQDNTKAHQRELKRRLDNDLEYIKRRKRELEKMLKDQERGERELSRVLATVIKDNAEQFRNLDDGMAVALGSLGEIIAAFSQLADVADDATEAQKKAANVQATVAIAGAVASIGNKVTGGRNYAAEAGAAGAAIGAVIGAFAAGLGAAAGAAIGGAVGTAAGSFMKKGSDEFLANVILGTNNVIASVQTKVEGEMGQIGRNFTHGIETGVQNALDSIGAEIQDLPGISIKVRDGVFSVFTDNMKKRFDSIEAAVDFAVLTALKKGNLVGISENVKKAIENSAAQTFRELSVDIDFAKMIDRLPKVGEAASEAALLIGDALEQFTDNVKHAQQLNISIGELKQAFGRDLQSIRNSILGVVETEEERIRREAEAFNREIELIRLQEQAKAADIALKKANLEAEAAILQAEADLAQSRLNLSDITLQAESDLFDREMDLSRRWINAHRSLLGDITVITAQIEALANAAAASAAILDSLPDLISAADIDRAIANAGGRGRGRGNKPTGPTREEEVSTLMDVIDQLTRANLSPFHQQLLSIIETFDKHIETARRLGEGEDELIKLRAEAIRQLKEQKILDPLREFLGPNAIEGGRYGMTDFEKQADDIRNKFDEIREANKALMEEGEGRAIEFWKINAAELRALKALAEEVIDTLGLPLEQTKDRIKAMKDALKFLRDMLEEGVINADRFGEVFAQMVDQAAADMLSMFADILDQMGETDKANDLRAKLAKLQFVIQITQLRLLYDSYVALGLIAGELKQQLDDLLGFIEDPANWPDFTIPNEDTQDDVSRPPRGGGGGQESLVEDYLDRLNSQIEEWMRMGIDPLILQARDMRKAYEELVEEGRRLHVSTTQLTEAFAHAVSVFVDEALSPFENLGESPLEREFRELQERLDVIRQAFIEIGASADDMERLEAASAAAMRDFWDRATEGIQSLMEEITGILEGPATRENLFGEMAHLQDLVARAQAGDLSALAEIEASGRSLLDLIEQVYGGGRAGSDLRAQLLELLGMAVDGSIYGVTDSPAGPISGTPGMGGGKGSKEEQTLSETVAMRQHLEQLRAESREQGDAMYDLVDSINRAVHGMPATAARGGGSPASVRSIRPTGGAVNQLKVA